MNLTISDVDHGQASNESSCVTFEIGPNGNAIGNNISINRSRFQKRLVSFEPSTDNESGTIGQLYSNVISINIGAMAADAELIVNEMSGPISQNTFDFGRINYNGDLSYFFKGEMTENDIKLTSNSLLGGSTISSYSDYTGISNNNIEVTGRQSLTMFESSVADGGVMTSNTAIYSATTYESVDDGSTTEFYIRLPDVFDSSTYNYAIQSCDPRFTATLTPMGDTETYRVMVTLRNISGVTVNSGEQVSVTVKRL